MLEQFLFVKPINRPFPKYFSSFKTPQKVTNKFNTNCLYRIRSTNVISLTIVTAAKFFDVPFRIRQFRTSALSNTYSHATADNEHTHSYRQTHVSKNDVCRESRLLTFQIRTDFENHHICFFSSVSAKHPIRTFNLCMVTCGKWIGAVSSESDLCKRKNCCDLQNEIADCIDFVCCFNLKFAGFDIFLLNFFPQTIFCFDINFWSTEIWKRFIYC